MKLFIYIDRIELIHKLIKQRRTGTPAELAQRLNLSTSRLYVILDDLKMMGAPITYSRQHFTYYYEYAFDVRISVEFQLLEQSQIQKVNGGHQLYKTKRTLLFLCSEGMDL